MKKMWTLNIAALIIICCFSIFLVSAITPYGSATTPDSLMYLDIASNFKNERGISSRDYSLANAHAKSFKVEKSWPPLYPIALTLFGGNAPEVTVIHASYLSAMLLCVSAYFIFLILVPYLTWFFSISASLLFCLTVPMLTIYTYAWSETLFIAMAIIATWSSIRYLEYDYINKNIKYTYLIILLSAIMASALTRYIGVVFYFLLIFTFIKGRKTRHNFFMFIFSSLLFWVTIGYLLMNNYVVTGSMSGVHRAPSKKTVISNMLDVSTAFESILPSSYIILMVVGVVALLLTIGSIKLETLCFKNTSKRLKSNCISTVLFIGVLYFISIVCLRSCYKFDALDVRLLAPLFPFIWLFLFVFSAFIFNNAGLKRTVCIFFIFLFTFLFPIEGYNRFIQTIENWRDKNSPKHQLTQGYIYANYTYPDHKNIYKLLALKIIDKESVIVTKNPLIWEFLTGIRSVQLPGRLDLKTVDRLNRLPDGSLMFIQEPKWKLKFKKFCDENSIIYKSIELGLITAVRLPLHSNSIQ